MQFIVFPRKSDRSKMDLLPYADKELKEQVLAKLNMGELRTCGGFYLQEPGFRFFDGTEQVVVNLVKITDSKLLITSEAIK